MGNQIELFYSKFSGVDTRSSKLLQDPGSFRQGTKNFRYDFQDQTGNRQGFQHKDSGAPNFIDIFEYKYRDVNTGAASIQTLGVATDGHLYRKKNHFLKFNTHTGFTSVSVYFDDVANTFKLVLNGAIPQTVAISDTMTLTQLETALDAISGVSTSIVDDDGNSVTSTKLAYLLDCVINDSTFANNPVYYWEKVPFPDSSSVPFPTTFSYNTSSDYEGISSVNLNNVIYMTDGGFPMKYDGKAVYRVGMPRTTRELGLDGITFGTNTSGNLSDNAGAYRYVFQLGYIDQNGFETLGYVTESDYVSVQLPAGQKSIYFNIPKVGNSDYMNNSFPIFSCTVNGIQNLAGTGAKTLTVLSGHNVQVGQCLRVPIANVTNSNTTTKGISYAYFEVTNTTATSVTINKTATGLVLLQGKSITLPLYFPMTLNNTSTATADVFNDTLIIQACWVPSTYIGKITEPSTDVGSGNTQAWSPTPLFGAFLRVFRSKAGAEPIYELVNLPISTQSSYFVLDELADTDFSNGVAGSLTTLLADFSTANELPRACKYLTLWQNQLVQAGCPVAPNEIISKTYPWYYGVAPTTGNKWSQSLSYVPWEYSEANLCDLQSIYWADALSPEGFPQDGTHEFAIDTKFADRVTAIAPNKDALFAFKERSTAVLTGSLAENDIVMEVLESDAGCSSHKSVEEVRGYLVWLDGINGFYSCVAGRLPENIGFPIQDYQKINSLGLNYKTATAANYRKESLYVCSVGTTTFVFDYADNGSLKRNCWYIWDGFNGKSVLATSDDKLLVWNGTQTTKMKLTLTDYDHSDHKSAISMVLNTAWLNQGHPTIDKHYVGLWINSIQGDFTLTVKQYGNFLEDLIGTQTNVVFIPESSAKKFIKAQVKACIPKLSSISFGMEHNQINKMVKIQGYELQYSLDFAVGEPKR